MANAQIVNRISFMLKEKGDNVLRGESTLGLQHLPPVAVDFLADGRSMESAKK